MKTEPSTNAPSASSTRHALLRQHHSSPMRSKPYGRYRTPPSRCSPATNVSKNLVSDLERGKKKRGVLRRGVRTSCETKLIRRHPAGWPTRMFRPFAVNGVGASYIGRAACREGVRTYVYISVAAVTLKKKK